MYNKILVFILSILLFNGCREASFYEKTFKITEEGWNSVDTLDYEVEVSDNDHPFNFYINIRNNNEYSYSNLYIFLETQFPDNTISRDTLEFLLADKSGKWLGKGQGRIRENDFLIRSNFLFPQSGTYNFSIEHGMRTDNLTGIEDVGIRIERGE